MFRPANCAIDRKTLRLLALLKTSESGSLASGGQVEPGGGMSRARSISDSSSVLPFARDGDLGAQLLAGIAQRLVDVRVGSD